MKRALIALAVLVITNAAIADDLSELGKNVFGERHKVNNPFGCSGQRNALRAARR